MVGHAGGDGDEDGDDGVDAFVEQRHGGSAVDEVGQWIDQFFPCVEWRGKRQNEERRVRSRSSRQPKNRTRTRSRVVNLKRNVCRKC